jgi:putative zinc finger/helix-turn-helix YgiT family protein
MNKKAKTKPFPWKCQNCGKRAVYDEVISYPATIEHDYRTYNFTVNGLRVPQCRECGAVFPDAEANRQITQAFRHHAKLLTQQRIRDGRERLGLTQKQLASALGVAEATISRWETGAQIQQRSLDNLLRLFFGIPQVRRVLSNEQLLSQLDFTQGTDITVSNTMVGLAGQGFVSVSYDLPSLSNAPAFEYGRQRLQGSANVTNPLVPVR